MPDNERRTVTATQTVGASSYVELIETLVTDFDLIDMLTDLTSRSVQLIHVAAAGILLADGTGHLRVIGASSEQIQLLELFQIQNDEGPCLDCYHTGKTINARMDEANPWPNFTAETLRSGFTSVCAVPMRLNEETFGCLNLFRAEAGMLSEQDVAVARSLADIASIAITQKGSTRDPESREALLQYALNSRIAVEQAKGMIAEHNQLDMDHAFKLLRVFAKSNYTGLTTVAEAVLDGTADINLFKPA